MGIVWVSKFWPKYLRNMELAKTASILAPMIFKDKRSTSSLMSTKIINLHLELYLRIFSLEALILLEHHLWHYCTTLIILLLGWGLRAIIGLLDIIPKEQSLLRFSWMRLEEKVRDVIFCKGFRCCIRRVEVQVQAGELC